MRVVFAPALTATVVVLVIASACSSPRQIEVSRPQSARSLPTGQRDADMSGNVNVVIESGPSELPDEVQALRFRIGEVSLRTTDGKWTSYPATTRSLELVRGAPFERTILATRIPLTRHDSIGISFLDVYAEFNENAGGPLTIHGDRPLKIGIDFSPESGRASIIRLRIDANASLLRLPSHQWHFLPYLTAEMDKT